MSSACIAALVSLVVGSCTPRGSDPSAAEPVPSAADASPPAVELVRGGKRVDLSEGATRVLVSRVEKALAICNFSSLDEPKLFGGMDLPALWLRRESAAHLRLRYDRDKAVDAVAGKLVFWEVLLSVDEPHGPEPALAKSSRGIYGLKKCGYDDRLLGCAPELEPHFARPAACPAGP